MGNQDFFLKKAATARDYSKTFSVPMPWEEAALQDQDHLGSKLSNLPFQSELHES